MVVRGCSRLALSLGHTRGTNTLRGVCDSSQMSCKLNEHHNGRGFADLTVSCTKHTVTLTLCSATQCINKQARGNRGTTEVGSPPCNTFSAASNPSQLGRGRGGDPASETATSLAVRVWPVRRCAVRVRQVNFPPRPHHRCILRTHRPPCRLTEL